MDGFGHQQHPIGKDWLIMIQEYKYFPSGDRGIMIEVGREISEDINRRIRQMVYCIRNRSIEGIVEIIPAYNTLLIIYNPIRNTYEELIEQLQKAWETMNEIQLPDQEVIHIPVLYGGIYGPDIDDVAAYNGLTSREIIDIHYGRDYLVYMLGFTPGFPYLGGMSERIATPRLDSPRERIPGGAVGIAGSQTGIYPIESPGGWRIIGRTPIRLFDPKRDSVFLLHAGNYIRFESIDEDTYKKISRKIEKDEYIVRKSFL